MPECNTRKGITKMENEGLQFLYLSEPDMLEAGVLDMKQCVRTMEDMFLLAGKGDYIMGGPKGNSHGIMLWYPENPAFEGMPKAGPDRRYMVMPAYLGGRFHVTGQKWYGSNVENIKINIAAIKTNSIIQPPHSHYSIFHHLIENLY